jgi:hypothetical protein
MRTIHVPVAELDQWEGAIAVVAGDPHADPRRTKRTPEDVLAAIAGVAIEAHGACVAVEFAGLGIVTVPATHELALVIADGAIYPCAEWGGKGPKPLADHWYWAIGDEWIAVRADWEPEWSVDADADTLAARPERHALPLSETPPFGLLRYCVDECDEVSVPVADFARPAPLVS